MNLDVEIHENPVSKSCELFLPPNNPQYRDQRIIPPEKSNFSIELCVQGKKFFGEGKTKKETKRVSEQKAIENLILGSNVEDGPGDLQRLHSALRFEKSS